MALTGPRPPQPAPESSPAPGDGGRSGVARAAVAVLLLTPLLRLAVVRHAVPAGSILRAGCAACGAVVELRHPWPALGPTARCRRCRARTGPRPGSVELAAVGAVALLVLLGPPVAELAAVAWWLGWVLPLCFIDLAVHRLPDRLTWPAAAGVGLLLGLAALTGAGAGPWLRAVLGGAGLALFFAATTLLLGARGFGLGDAKLALGAGALLAWHGWPVLVAGLLLALGLSALVSLGLLAARRARWSSHLPFGPFLVLGTLAALLLSG
ncbi:prepilin peptidase [Micromonospora musae]|uniref:Prepilin peptidase n=1 Tax=Micromonospora musae TaxID=1894970 RepID=A0ABX9RJT2_9ACTN|nr:prepilin peptidase [Micromonospora musae]